MTVLFWAMDLLCVAGAMYYQAVNHDKLTACLLMVFAVYFHLKAADSEKK